MVITWQDVEVYHGSFLNVWARTTSRPLGGTSRFEVVTRPDAVAIVALRRADAASEPSVALVRQLRPAVGTELWEIPAGLIRDEERGDPLRTAQRELREETGAQGGRWHELAHEYSSPGFSTEQITLFLAEDVEVPAGAGPQDSTEIPQIQWVPLSQALALRQSGTIQDGKTLLGLTLASAAIAPMPQTLEGGAEMPLDPTNVPHSRAARFRDPVDLALADRPAAEESGRVTTGASVSAGAEAGLETSLKMQDMLLEEYNYANVSNYQAAEDRARMFNNYLLIVGGAAAGSIGVVYQLNQIGLSVYAGPAADLILLAISLLGIGFFVSMVRLRQTFNNSLLAMSIIKEFYLIQFGRAMPQAKYGFWWRLSGLPKKERIGSVFFILSAVIAMVNSLCLGAAALLTTLLVQNGNQGTRVTSGLPLAIGAAAIVISAVVQFRRYFGATTSEKSIGEAERRLWLLANESGVDLSSLQIPKAK